MSRIVSYLESGERYPVLRIAGVAFTGIGAVLVIVASLFLVYGLSSLAGDPAGLRPPPATPPVVLRTAAGLSGGLAVLSALALLVTGVQFVAMGALVRLAIHVEENTRATAQCLEKVCSRLSASGGDPGVQFVS